MTGVVQAPHGSLPKNSASVLNNNFYGPAENPQKIQPYEKAQPHYLFDQLLYLDLRLRPDLDWNCNHIQNWNFNLSFLLLHLSIQNYDQNLASISLYAKKLRFYKNLNSNIFSVPYYHLPLFCQTCFCPFLFNFNPS